MKKFAGEHKGELIFQVDAGGLFAAQGKPGDEARNRAMLEGMTRLGVAVVNLSPGDARVLPTLGARPKLPALISANVRGNAPAYVVRAGAQGQRIAFVGVSAMPLPEEPGVTVEDPKAALRRLIPELKQKADSIVVLAYMPNQDVVSLAANFPELDAIVSAYEHQGAAVPYQIGHAWIMQAEYEGKFVGFAGLEFGPDRRVAKLDPHGMQVLDTSIADQPELAALVAKVKNGAP